MQVKKFLYPGDPPAEMAIMSRAEFLRLYPRPTLHEEEEAYATRRVDFFAMLEPDEIVCDQCNQDVIGDVYVIRYESPPQCRGSDRAYCKACAEKGLLRYCE
jgi:hypothetical protein